MRGNMEAQGLVQKSNQERKIWPKVAIIVLNWNGWRDTIECLGSLQRTTYPNYQIIVVDNGSTDGSVAYIRAAYPNLTLIETGKNLGYAGGNNAGIRYGLEQGAEYILILNNDVKIEPNTLTAMIEAAAESNAGVVGALIKDDSNGKVSFVRSRYPATFLYSEHQHHIPNKKLWPSFRVEGSAMLLRRDILLERMENFGYFLDERLFLYCEETELGMWCRRVGRKTVVARDAIVYHKVGASSGGKEQPLQFYYLTRNRLLLSRRYLRGLIRILFEIFYPLWRMTRAGYYLIRGRYKVTWAILQGLLDGYKGRTGRGHD